MVKDEVKFSAEKKKSFKEKRIKEFLDMYGETSLKLNDEKIKLCSSDDFNELSIAFSDLQKAKRAPIMISQVGGFYVMASQAGYAAANSRVKPSLLFFDRKTNNIANAIYNTLLMQACDKKEDYITTLFGLDDKSIIQGLDPAKYESYIIQVYRQENDTQGVERKRVRVKALRDYRRCPEYYDEIIAKNHDLPHRAMRDKEECFDVAKLEQFARSKEYDPEKHYKLLMKQVEGKLSNENMALFESIAKSMTEYLAKNKNYDDLVKYLAEDIKKNGGHHILCRDDLYEGYKSLINKKGHSAVHFLPGIDISTDAGLAKLERVLENEGFIGREQKPNTFPIDIAFLPHAESLQESYQFIKKNVERYIKVNRSGSNDFSMHPTAGLNVRTYDSIGATFIEESRKKRKPLTHLTPVEPAEKGFPLISFMAGANIGNIYNSEEDIQNVIDMAIADHVDTMYIQGLIYSTFYHNQVARRGLIDPKYETLDQRLKAAKKLVKRLNDAGIKVVYQMGDEEEHLADDMFTIYTREQGVKGYNFLAREDNKSTHDWVKPIIRQQLIPYLIRSGEDVTNFFTDEETQTRVTELCVALKNYSEGLPLGDLGKFIKPEFLKDNDNFRVVHSTVDQYGDDPAIKVSLEKNPMFSSNTQYADPTKGIVKRIRIYQSGALGNTNEIPQLFVDGRQGMQSISYYGDQVALNVPQMIDDSKYLLHPELLPGMREVKSDPTYARINKVSTRPNYPGSWTVTGDAREKMTIIPYWKRSREVMEHVNKTGKPLEEVDVFYLNDIQAGSLTERLEYTLKALDHFFYDYKYPKGILGNGDLVHGWNYKSYANENRHVGAMSIAQQMVDIVKLLQPWLREAFGVINPFIFKGEYEDFQIDPGTSEKIINHLKSIDAIDYGKGFYQNVCTIKDGVDYNSLDLQLPPELKPYERVIRAKLLKLRIFKFIHLAEGNHEYNSDWDKKGINLYKMLKQYLDEYSDFIGSDMEIALSEFVVNKKGDIIQSPQGCKTINGYNISYAHLLQMAKGDTPTKGMSKHFDRLGSLADDVHRVVMGHLHIFETSVIDNKLYSVTGCGAGQSGYEQDLGLASRPLFAVDRYLPDGRLAIDTIGTEFLKDYQIQNPIVKEIGLENFIAACLSEEASIYAFNGKPDEVQPIHQRQLVIRDPYKVVGPNIP